MFQATRRRLALYYTIVTAVLLIIFAVGIYSYVYKTLIDRIDDTLKHVMEIVEPSLVIEEVSLAEGKYQINLDASFRQHPNTINKVEDDHIDLEWFDANGELEWQTLENPLPIPLSFHSGGKTIRISSDYLLRQVTKRIEIGRYVLGYLRVSHPLFDVVKPIRELVIDLSIAVIFLISSVGAMGWFLSGLAMEPVKESYQSLKQFTADASHELRNPIATIKTNVQTLLNYPDIDQKTQTKQLEIIDRLTARLTNLVNDLLFLARADSRINSPEFELIPLDSLLLEVVEEQKIIAQQKSINLQLNIIESNISLGPEDEKNQEILYNLEGDWQQLNRLFSNLISNSLIHGFPNDSNFIKKLIKVNLETIKKQQKSYYQIEISDNGIGIKSEILPYIFDRFYRGDSARHRNTNTSTGLGMAIVQAIVENHHGTIKVESQPSQGTKIIIILPIPKNENY
ncbi:MAG: HAMP domain-containing histidine kinase [Cyanobacterium sp. T60_A2020_053]|nr:HAMP domain-containing histidine kinase [Cyanobacterium sp. T60_A2020_053]